MFFVSQSDLNVSSGGLVGTSALHRVCPPPPCDVCAGRGMGQCSITRASWPARAIRSISSSPHRGSRDSVLCLGSQGPPCRRHQPPPSTAAGCSLVRAESVAPACHGGRVPGRPAGPAADSAEGQVRGATRGGIGGGESGRARRSMRAGRRAVWAARGGGRAPGQALQQQHASSSPAPSASDAAFHTSPTAPAANVPHDHRSPCVPYPPRPACPSATWWSS